MCSITQSSSGSYSRHPRRTTRPLVCRQVQKSRSKSRNPVASRSRTNRENASSVLQISSSVKPLRARRCAVSRVRDSCTNSIFHPSGSGASRDFKHSQLCCARSGSVRPSAACQTLGEKAVRAAVSSFCCAAAGIPVRAHTSRTQSRCSCCILNTPFQNTKAQPTLTGRPRFLNQSFPPNLSRRDLKKPLRCS